MDGRVHKRGVVLRPAHQSHFTLKTRLLKRDDLRDFITCYHPANRRARTATERFRYFTYGELVARDKASLDVFWLMAWRDVRFCKPPRG